jgi:hypothetical protein
VISEVNRPRRRAGDEGAATSCLLRDM